MMSKEEGKTDIHGTEKEYPLGGREGVRPNSDESNQFRNWAQLDWKAAKRAVVEVGEAEPGASSILGKYCNH